MSTIRKDVPVADAGPLTIDGGADAFLSRMLDAEKPSKAEDEGEQEAEVETTEAEGSEGADEAQDAEGDEDPSVSEDDEEGSSEEESEDQEDQEGSAEDKKADKGKKNAPDDLEVEITVGDETHKVSVKDLKRLYGQEAALTRKSQEAAQLRKTAEETAQKHGAALERLMKAAQERWKPYENIDFMLAAKEMDSESYKQLRADAQDAFGHLKFIQTELEGYVSEQENQRKAAFTQAAQDAIKTLSDPEKGIPGWNNQLYDEIRTFAVAQGMEPGVVNSIIDPTAIKIINFARLYLKGKQAAAEKVKRVANAPKKVLKTTTTPTTKDATGQKKMKALEALKKSGGNRDAAADAFLASMLGDDE